MIRKFVSMYDNRLAEWCTSFVMFGFAITLLLPGDTAGELAKGFFERNGITDGLAGPILLVVSIMRMVSLYINGHWPKSPYIRIVGGTVGAMTFFSLAVSFSVPTILGDMDFLSTAFFTYFVLGVTDLLSVYRASADARYYESYR